MSPLPASLRQRARDDERGVIMIMFALLLVGLLVMAALVLEFGQIRDDRQTNKSAADFAVMAGLANLESDDLQGTPQPWKGVCAAIDWLVANNSRFAGLTGTFRNGHPSESAASVTYTSTLCDAQPANPYKVPCLPNDRDTWAWFHGVSSDGRLAVDIKSGYEMPDPNFSGTDANALGGADTGDSDQGFCDNFAVIVGQARPRGFSAVIGSDDLSSQIRSVGRVLIGEENDQAVALLLLERVDCRAVRTVGSNAKILVTANTSNYDPALNNIDAARPGFIHADSNGSGSCPGGSRVIEGEDLVPSNGQPDPSIEAEHARHPVTGAILVEGRISSPSVSANPAKAHSNWPNAVGEPEPVVGPVIGRSPADDRYLSGETDRYYVPDLYQDVNTRFATGPDATWHVVSGAGCTTPGTIEPPAPLTKVWFDCGVDVPGGAALLVQANPADDPDLELTDVVIDGDLKIGNAGTFHVPNVRNLYIDGKTSGNVRGIDNSGGNLLINTQDHMAAGECAEVAVEEFRTTVMVVRKGSLYGSNGTTRLCQTFVYMMNNANGYPGAPGDPISGASPYNCGGCNGAINVSGSGVVDWKAPNSIDTRRPTEADLALHPFEDLALWTESSQASVIGGNGGIFLSGIYFLPNADPYRILGAPGGLDIIADAQFITRKLELNGNATLKMQPDPNNSLPIPLFEGFLLVR